MDARQKRLLRKEQAKKRKQLVYEQHVIETTRCKGCTDRKREYTGDRHNYKTTVTQECGHCPYFKRLNAIGGELLNLSEHQKTLKERESTIMVAKQDKVTQTSVTVKYERSALTPERYQEHKKVDKFTDDKIRELYSNYPKSSFEKWKSDNGLTKSYKKDATPAAATERADQRKYDKLKLDYDSLKSQYEKTLDKCKKLEAELVIEQEAHTMKNDLLNLLEADIEKLKQTHKATLNAGGASNECSSCTELTKYKQIADDATRALENLRQEIATMLQQRDEQDEEVAEAINKQMKRFCQYETMLLERILQLKREK